MSQIHNKMKCKLPQSHKDGRDIVISGTEHEHQLSDILLLIRIQAS